MLRGLTTVSFFADDITAARSWYAELLGIEPYFVREASGTPVYVEFRVGDYQHELGIVDSRFAAGARPGTASGAVIYWHVDDVQASFERLVSLGATVHEAPVERGPDSLLRPWWIHSGTSSASCTTSITCRFSARDQMR
jgi:predicted enzyme related to lactoylglutathione lyase